MSELYKVRLTKETLVFCSAHFITYEGDRCERLHGHNYRAAIEVEGPLDENRYVFDFIALEQRAREITAELDHRMLLPTGNRWIHVEAAEAGVSVRYRDREWRFPREDCVLLPIENTTAELLASYIGQRLRDVLRERHQFTPAAMRVDVEEGPGQSAIWQWSATG